jgi:hypothetical protein
MLDQNLNPFGCIPLGLPRFCHSGERRNPEKERLDAGSSPA